MSAELISTEDIKDALDTLRELNDIRKEISKNLGSISVKYQLREKVLSNLYSYYELVTDDYYSLIDRVLKVPEAIELVYEGLLEQRSKLILEMDRLQDVLENPIELKDSRPVIQKIENHFLYQMRRHLAKEPEELENNI